MKRTTARGPAVLGAAALVAILLAACGGGGSAATTTSTSTKAPTTNSADTQNPSGGTGAAGRSLASRTALTACLKKYGVTLPSFGGAGGFGGPTGAGGRRFPLGGATGATGRRFPFGGATGARGRAGGFPGAGGGSGGFASNPKFAAALKKCGGSAAFGGGFGRFGGTGRTGAFSFSTGIRTELTSFVACMKKNGETLPAPNLGGTGSIFGNVNQKSATFTAAYAKCKGILTYLNRPRGATGPAGSTTG